MFVFLVLADSDGEPPLSPKSAERASATRRYRQHYGHDALLRLRVADRRRQANLLTARAGRRGSQGSERRSTSVSESKPSPCVHTIDRARCGQPCLPASRYCTKHICSDASQHLFVPCQTMLADGNKCNEPMAAYMGTPPYRCKLHADPPASNLGAVGKRVEELRTLRRRFVQKREEAATAMTITAAAMCVAKNGDKRPIDGGQTAKDSLGSSKTSPALSRGEQHETSQSPASEKPLASSGDENRQTGSGSGTRCDDAMATSSGNGKEESGEMETSCTYSASDPEAGGAMDVDVCQADGSDQASLEVTRTSTDLCHVGDVHRHHPSAPDSTIDVTDASKEVEKDNKEGRVESESSPPAPTRSIEETRGTRSGSEERAMDVVELKRSETSGPDRTHDNAENLQDADNQCTSSTLAGSSVNTNSS